MNFSVSPAGPFTPQTDNGFPRFIQFQQDGVNLGGPDIDTVNFISPLIAIRSTSGLDENTVLVTILE